MLIAEIGQIAAPVSLNSSSALVHCFSAAADETSGLDCGHTAAMLKK
jgi:hypothetical protein